MSIVSLWSVCCISRVRRVIVLPADIHKAVILLTRCVQTNFYFNTYFVTKCLLVDKKDPNPSCSKSRLIPNSKAICRMMGTASWSTLQTSEARNDESIAVVAMAWVAFEGFPLSDLGMSPGRESGMPKEYSTARTVWTKFSSSMYVIHFKFLTTRESKRHRWTYIRLAQGFE